MPAGMSHILTRLTGLRGLRGVWPRAADREPRGGDPAGPVSRPARVPESAGAPKPPVPVSAAAKPPVPNSPAPKPPVSKPPVSNPPVSNPPVSNPPPCQTRRCRIRPMPVEPARVESARVAAAGVRGADAAGAGAVQAGAAGAEPAGIPARDIAAGALTCVLGRVHGRLAAAPGGQPATGPGRTRRTGIAGPGWVRALAAGRAGQPAGRCRAGRARPAMARWRPPGPRRRMGHVPRGAVPGRCRVLPGWAAGPAGWSTRRPARHRPARPRSGWRWRRPLGR